MFENSSRDFFKTFVKVLLINNAVKSGYNVSIIDSSKLEFTKEKLNVCESNNSIDNSLDLANWFEIMMTQI